MREDFLENKKNKHRFAVIFSPHTIITLLPLIFELCIIFLFSWKIPFLFLFPSLTWGFGIIMTLMSLFKENTQPHTHNIIINPLGEEKHLALMFSISSAIQLVLLLFLGWDGTIHPQLMDNYSYLYIIPIIFCFTVTWSLAIWHMFTQSKIKINYNIKTGKYSEISEEKKQTPTIIYTHDTKKKNKIQLMLFGGGFILLSLIISDSLIIFFSKGLKGLFPVTLTIPLNNETTQNEIFLSGFIFILLGTYILLGIRIAIKILLKIKINYVKLVQKIETALVERSTSDSYEFLAGLKSFSI